MITYDFKKNRNIYEKQRPNLSSDTKQNTNQNTNQSEKIVNIESSKQKELENIVKQANQENIENKPKIIENKTLEEDIIYFIVVKCKDGNFYSSVTGLTIEKSLKNMNVGKGPNYTKPYNRRPVSLLLSLKIKDKLKGNEFKKQFDSWSMTVKKKYIKNN